MKRMIMVIFLAGLGFAAFAQSGVIKELSGTVELKPAGAAAFVPAAVGAQVDRDTVISTGFKSLALLEVGSAQIVVQPITRLTLTEISASQGTEALSVNLQAGRVRIDVNPPAGAKASLSITSPTAVASVRGTSFYFDTMNVNVREGTVFFKGNAGYTVQVGAGSFSGIAANSKASVAQNTANTGFAPANPIGYEAAARTTGGTGVTSNSPGGGSGGDNGVGVDIDITF